MPSAVPVAAPQAMRSPAQPSPWRGAAGRRGRTPPGRRCSPRGGSRRPRRRASSPWRTPPPSPRRPPPPRARRRRPCRRRPRRPRAPGGGVAGSGVGGGHRRTLAARGCPAGRAGRTRRQALAPPASTVFSWRDAHQRHQPRHRPRRASAPRMVTTRHSQGAHDRRREPVHQPLRPGGPEAGGAEPSCRTVWDRAGCRAVTKRPGCAIRSSMSRPLDRQGAPHGASSRWESAEGVGFEPTMTLPP